MNKVKKIKRIELIESLETAGTLATMRKFGLSHASIKMFVDGEAANGNVVKIFKAKIGRKKNCDII